MWRGAAAICVNERQELLMILQGRADEEKRWSVPAGGAWDEHETYEACCAREVWEETGYEAKVGKFLHQKQGVIKGLVYKVNYYEIEIIGGQPTLHDPDELIYDIQWKSAEEIAGLTLTYPEDRTFLLEYVTRGGSGIIHRSVPLTVRKLTDDHRALLRSWLNDPEVLRYYEGRDRPHSLAMVEAYFEPGDDQEYRCMIEYEDTAIGYLQYYALDEEGQRSYELDETELGGELIFGLDLFIGDRDYWNKGIGQQLIRSICHHLAEHRGASRVVVDPQNWNERAIACYEKSGFHKVKLLEQHEWHEGEKRDCWLMEWRV